MWIFVAHGSLEFLWVAVERLLNVISGEIVKSNFHFIKNQ